MFALQVGQVARRDQNSFQYALQGRPGSPAPCLQCCSPKSDPKSDPKSEVESHNEGVQAQHLWNKHLKRLLARHSRTLLAVQQCSGAEVE